MLAVRSCTFYGLSIPAQFDKQASNILFPLCRPGLSVLEASGLPKASFSLLCLSYSGNKLPASRPVPFIVDVFSDNVFNFDAA